MAYARQKDKCRASATPKCRAERPSCCPPWCDVIQVSDNVIRLAERPTDGALVRAATAGDESAKAELYRRYVGMVANTVYRILGYEQDLDDILQDTFVVALGSLHKLADPQAFGAWLRRIAVGTTVGVLRRKRMLSRLGLLKPVSSQMDQL